MFLSVWVSLTSLVWPSWAVLCRYLMGKIGFVAYLILPKNYLLKETIIYIEMKDCVLLLDER